MNKKLLIVFSLVATVAVLTQCTKNDSVVDVNSFKALPLTVTTPLDNPQTTEKIALGRMLFWDPILSGNKDVACATCHHASLGYTDNLDLSIGVNGTGLGIGRHFTSPNGIPFSKRNSLTIINTAFNGIDGNGFSNPSAAAMFFDNRTQSLELQSLEPMKTLEEMKGTKISAAAILDSIANRLKNLPEYVQLFNEVFAGDNGISVQNIGKAIASYERTIISNHSPYDQYVRGDKTALTTSQINGMAAFQNSGCIKCHTGPMFSDYSLHVLSVPDNSKLPTDAGANGTYAFRTPSLR
ncbi:MAG: cytochrome-c peroxidase, partial [Bacteroidota bacterium]|nr:cytochrome-c peroxidase [Bacteroidota bacterium]